jgi:serine phosphatase RsbU (regulator of sigma subunit)
MKLTLGQKILMLYSAIGVCVLATIGMLMWGGLRKELFSTKITDMQDQLAHIDYGLTTFFSQIEQDLLTIAASDAVQNRADDEFTNFLNADPSTFAYDIGPAEQRIIDVFRRYKDHHPYVNSVYMGRENGGFVRSHPRNLPTRFDPRMRPWYRLAKKHPAQVMMTPPYAAVTTADVNIGIVKALTAPDGSVYGVVGMDITLETLTGYVENVAVGQKGYLLLLDQDGIILASPDKGMIFQHIEVLCRDNLDPLFNSTKGSLLFTRDGQKHYLVYRESDHLGWKVSFVIPTQEINAEVARFVGAIIGVLLLSLIVLSGFTLLGLRQFVVNPLRTLDSATRAIARTGDLDVTFTIDSRDEIGSLARSFKQMTRDLKDHIQQLTESTAARERVEGELKIAHDIQMGILCHDFPDHDAVDVYAILEPARQVGGDLYDVFFVDEKRLCISIGDVSGKGIPAAVFMSGAKTLIKAIAAGKTDPADILSMANRELTASNEYGAFVTVFLGILDLESLDFRYTSGGHNPPFLLDPNGEPTLIAGARCLALGIVDDAEFVSETVRMAPGQGIYMYTDGVTEASNPEGDLFGEKRVEEVLSRCRRCGAREIVDAMLAGIQDFLRDAPQSDDITMLALKIPATGKTNES